MCSELTVGTQINEYKLWDNSRNNLYSTDIHLSFVEYSSPFLQFPNFYAHLLPHSNQPSTNVGIVLMDVGESVTHNHPSTTLMVDISKKWTWERPSISINLSNRQDYSQIVSYNMWQDAMIAISGQTRTEIDSQVRRLDKHELHVNRSKTWVGHVLLVVIILTSRTIYNVMDGWCVEYGKYLDGWGDNWSRRLKNTKSGYLSLNSHLS